MYLGSDAGVAAYAGAATRSIDLGGRSLMPGLIDGHVHPLEGGIARLECNLNYDALTVPQFQARIRA